MFFSSCQKTSVHNATSSDLRSVESSGNRKEEGYTLLDITFRQRHLNRRCHKSISHANAYRDLRDAMRSYTRKYLLNSQNNGTPCESNKFATGQDNSEGGKGTVDFSPLYKFPMHSKFFYIANAFMDVSPFPKCISTYVKIARFLAPAQAIFLIFVALNKIRMNHQQRITITKLVDVIILRFYYFLIYQVRYYPIIKYINELNSFNSNLYKQQIFFQIMIA